MNAVERWAVRDDFTKSFLFIGFGLVGIIIIVLAWANPAEGSTLGGQVGRTVAGGLVALMFGGVGLYGLYSAGVVTGANGWDDGLERQEFNRKIAERRTKLEAKLL